MGERNRCKECPWVTQYKHSEKWKGYVKELTDKGLIKDGVHKCHMIASDTWGFETPVDESNVCIGSLKKDNDEGQNSKNMGGCQEGSSHKGGDN
jgi:hypothetical protein